MEVKERFRDWNLYHKTVVLVLAGATLWGAAWAVIVIDGAFEFEYEKTLPYSAETIWPWVVGDENRPRWTTELIDIGELTGEPGEQDTTRLLFWRQGYKRWQAVERVTDVVAGRVINYAQESDLDQRWYRVELVPASACETRVILKETIMPLEYAKRFWFFRETDVAEQRLATSANALGRWVSETAPICNQADGSQ